MNITSGTSLLLILFCFMKYNDCLADTCAARDSFFQTCTETDHDHTKGTIRSALFQQQQSVERESRMVNVRERVGTERLVNNRRIVDSDSRISNFPARVPTDKPETRDRRITSQRAINRESQTNSRREPISTQRIAYDRNNFRVSTVRASPAIERASLNRRTVESLDSGVRERSGDSSRRVLSRQTERSSRVQRVSNTPRETRNLRISTDGERLLNRVARVSYRDRDSTVSEIRERSARVRLAERFVHDRQLADDRSSRTSDARQRTVERASPERASRLTERRYPVTDRSTRRTANDRVTRNSRTSDVPQRATAERMAERATNRNSRGQIERDRRSTERLLQDRETQRDSRTSRTRSMQEENRRLVERVAETSTRRSAERLSRESRVVDRDSRTSSDNRRTIDSFNEDRSSRQREGNDRSASRRIVREARANGERRIREFDEDSSRRLLYDRRTSSRDSRQTTDVRERISNNAARTSKDNDSRTRASRTSERIQATTRKITQRQTIDRTMTRDLQTSRRERTSVDDISDRRVVRDRRVAENRQRNVDFRARTTDNERRMAAYRFSTKDENNNERNERRVHSDRRNDERKFRTSEDYHYNLIAATRGKTITTIAWPNVLTTALGVLLLAQIITSSSDPKKYGLHRFTSLLNAAKAKVL